MSATIHRLIATCTMMALTELRLRNFKGQSGLEIKPGGKGFSIYGDNAVGKTTVADALSWLLWGKDYSGRSDFEIKTIDERTGQPMKGLEHEVYAEFDVDGDVISFQKVYKELWQKKRGAATSEFSGHTTDHRVNGVPVNERDYQDQVKKLCEPRLMQMLSLPGYFCSSMKWEDRRRAILEVCGDITDADVIASNSKLAELPGILGRYSMDDYRKIVTAKRKEINAEIAKIPVRLDELRRTLGQIDARAEVVDVDALREKLRQFSEDRARITAGGAIAEKTVELREVEAEASATRTKLHEAAYAGGDSLRKALSEANSAVGDCETKIRNLKRNLEDDREAAARANAKVVQLRADFATENAKEFAPPTAATCAACGQSLPADKVEAAREAALAQFNGAKARKITEIQTEGKELRKRLDAMEGAIEKLVASLEIAEAHLPVVTEARDKAKAALDALATPDVSANETVTALEARRSQVLQEIIALREDNRSGLDAIDNQSREVQAEIAKAESALASRQSAENAKARIAELEEQERAFASEIERIDREIFLTEEFVRTKVTTLERRINERFSFARFRMFDTQVNGAITETCEAMVDGVGYSDLNTGSKVNVGLDIIAVLSDHYGFAPPVIIDGAESITKLLPTPGQQIRLVVSEPDKSLRVVVDA